MVILNTFWKELIHETVIFTWLWLVYFIFNVPQLNRFFMCTNYIFRRFSRPGRSPRRATWEAIFTFMNEEAKLGILVGRKVSHTGGGGEGAHSSREESEWASGASEWVAVEARAWGRSQCLFFCALCCLLVSTDIWHHCCDYVLLQISLLRFTMPRSRISHCCREIFLKKKTVVAYYVSFKQTFKCIVLISVLHV